MEGVLNSDASLDFCPVLARMISSGVAEGQSGRSIEIASSISTVNNLLVIRNILMAREISETLETGMRAGGSCLVFTQSLRDRGAPSGVRHVAVDPYQRHPFNDACGLRAIERAGLSTLLDFREEFSSSALPALLKEGRVFSVIYVDGSHNFEDVFVDMYYSTKLLRMGGLVLFDDSQSKGVRKVLQFVRKNLGPSLREVDLTPYRPAVSLKYQIARRLNRHHLSAFEKVGQLERPYGYGFTNF